MKASSVLKNVSIVLVETRTPGNIGAAARCMMNMGLGNLVLVNPPPDPHDQARTLAAGADAVLSGALRFSSLEEAVADHGLVLGTSRQQGRLRKNIETPREAASRVLPLLGRNRAALVFGNEVNGLEKDHLKLCHHIISIPSSDAFPSLNLSHAVMVMAYELFIASLGAGPAASKELASGRELNLFYAHLGSTLERIGFLEPGNRDRMMFSFRQIFGRALLDPRELSILRGVLSNIERLARSAKNELS